jgi:hypothetical protein
MNTDCVIYIKTKNGETTWTYRKEKKNWSQTAPTGMMHPLTCDQLLSHLLPPLAGDQPGLSVSVERAKRRTKTTTLNIR